MDKSTKSKPPKPPRKDWPFYWHKTGGWAKTIKGRRVYFGKDDQIAWQRWQDLLAGKNPKPRDEPTVRDVCNHFIAWKQELLDSGEISYLTFRDYDRSCVLLISELGRDSYVSDLRPNDFQKLRATLAQRFGLHRLAKEIRNTKHIFKWAWEAEIIDSPVRFGVFEQPNKTQFRKHRNRQPAKFFEAEEIRRLLGAANAQMKAMILLGINCGLGNEDVAKLRIGSLDLSNGWIDYPRPKTGVQRRCPLWDQSVAALREWLEKRREPKSVEESDLVFVTNHGQCWARESDFSALSKEFRKLLDTTDLYQRGRGFYALRHSFETIGGETGDQVAVNAIMGHSDNSMAANYRHRISDERLRRVAATVGDWLFHDPEDGKQENIRRLRVVG